MCQEIVAPNKKARSWEVKRSSTNASLLANVVASQLTTAVWNEGPCNQIVVKQAVHFTSKATASNLYPYESYDTH